ncbi:MAG: branched-chain amino acid ABC transporter permease [Actinomycetota bacterium]
MLVGLQFHSELVGPSLVLGVVEAGMYGLLAIALVLTFRVSRTVAFVHGGLAILGAVGYWLLTYPPSFAIPFSIEPYSLPGRRLELPGLVALLIVVGVGTVLGAGYGRIVTGRRMSQLSRPMLTTFSIGIMLLLAGIVTDVFYIQPDAIPKSPFGPSQFWVLGWYLSVHRIVSVATAVALMLALAFVLTRTRFGVDVRAIADDIEASQWAGVNLRRTGTMVYAGAGGIATLAGALMAPMIGPDPFSVFFLFLRALTVAVVGGFSSFTLALGGAVVLGLVDTALRTGLVGRSTLGQREMVIMAIISLVVVVVARRRPVLELVDESI